ncbi:serine O-acetyltransferase [Croceibacterium aestuarii]|uniref:serine O-acetyltransferase n=1 Tax=Croceibacterium aestuarii TaxID=3064139 RepID=UPI0034E29E78
MDAMTLYRFGRGAYLRGWHRLAKSIDRANYALTRCVLPSSCAIGQGTRLAYGGLVVVVHAGARVGERCLLGQAITIGAKEAFVGRKRNLAPRIGDDVYIASGAKVLGDIEIGSNSVIGANSVVLQSFPPYSVIVGAPARVVGTTEPGYKAIRSNADGG